MALEAQGEELGVTVMMGVVEMMAASAWMWAETIKVIVALIICQ